MSIDAVLHHARAKTFAWGEHDCVIFAASVVDAYHGTRVREYVRKRWPVSSAAEYARTVRAAGGLDALVQEVLGPPHTDCAFRKGDIALVLNYDDTLILTVVVPPIALAPTAYGLQAFSLNRVVSRWSIDKIGAPCLKQ